MENQIKVISDTGDESQFQTTPLFNEQFGEVGRVIQEHYDYFKDKIDYEFKDLYERLDKEFLEVDEKLDKYNSKFIDILIDKEKDFNLRLNNFKLCIEDQIRVLNSFFNTSLKFVENDIKDLKFNLESHIISNSQSFNKIEEGISNYITTINANELQIIILENRVTEHDKLLRDTIDGMTLIVSDIQKLDKQKVSIKKPWYKRIFS